MNGYKIYKKNEYSNKSGEGGRSTAQPTAYYLNPYLLP